MLGDKLLPGTKPGFLKSEKMLGEPKWAITSALVA